MTVSSASTTTARLCDASSHQRGKCRSAEALSVYFYPGHCVIAVCVDFVVLFIASIM